MPIKISATPTTDAYEIPDVGLYEWAVARVREPQTQPNPYYRPDTDPDYKAERTSILIECQVIGDPDGRFAEVAETVHAYFDLYENNDGTFRPSKKLWELIAATGGDVEDLEELAGSTFWAQATHYTKANNTTGVKIVSPTDKAPTPRNKTRARIARQAPPQAVADPIEDEPPFPDDDDTPFAIEPAPSLTPLEQTLIAEVQATDDPDDLSYLAKRYRRTNVLTPAVEEAIRFKSRAFQLTA